MHKTRFLSLAQASYVSDLTERELNRVVDESLIPDELIIQSERTRLFSVLGIAFATFYFASAQILSALSRKAIVTQAHKAINANGKGSKLIASIVSGSGGLESPRIN